MSEAAEGGTANRRDHGFALLIVLWTIVLLTLLVTHISSLGRGEVLLASNIRQAAVMESAADGAIAEAIFHALDSSAQHWRADGAVHQLSVFSVRVDVRVVNQAGRINPNTAQLELLQALFRTLGADLHTAASVAAAIVDWRFPDAQVRAAGAKTPQYRDAGRNYGPPGAPFQSIDELRLVLGMTPELFARAAPYLSIYHDGEPDPRSASRPVLQAIQEASEKASILLPSSPPETVVEITATATGAENGRFVRQAVVKLGARSDGRLYEILTWTTGED